MRYLCVTDDAMMKTFDNLFKTETMFNFIRYCARVSYDDVFEFIIDKYLVHRLYFEHVYDGNPGIDTFFPLWLKKISAIGFSKEFKVRLLTQIISKKIPAHVRNSKAFYSKNIPMIYDYFGQSAELDIIYSSNGDVDSYSGIIKDGKFIDCAFDVDVYDTIIKNMVVTISKQW